MKSASENINSERAHQTATVTVSDPWGFLDDNDGRWAFVADIDTRLKDGRWLLCFRVPINAEGKVWRYAVADTRYVGQRYFDDPTERIRAANLILITEARAAATRLGSALPLDLNVPAAGLIGTVEPGISKLIPVGADSLVDRAWKPKR